mgnify:CR=1 FL=1
MSVSHVDSWLVILGCARRRKQGERERLRRPQSHEAGERNKRGQKQEESDAGCGGQRGGRQARRHRELVVPHVADAREQRLVEARTRQHGGLCGARHQVGKEPRDEGVRRARRPLHHQHASEVVRRQRAVEERGGDGAGGHGSVMGAPKARNAFARAHGRRRRRRVARYHRRRAGPRQGAQQRRGAAAANARFMCASRVHAVRMEQHADRLLWGTGERARAPPPPQQQQRLRPDSPTLDHTRRAARVAPYAGRLRHVLL